MGTDAGRESVAEESAQSRRRLLGLVGTGGVAAAVALTAKPAAAGHDATNTLHIAEENLAPVGESTSLGGDTSDAVLKLHNANTGDPSMALYAATDGLKAIIGETHTTGPPFSGGASIEGVSSSELGYGLGAGVGLSGVSGTGAGVLGSSAAEGPGGFGAGTGVGVLGHADNGTAVRALSASGLALEVHGRAAFTTAGNDTIPRHRKTVAVEAPAVTETSHITLTFTSDPGSGRVSWIERQPGTGFTVHLATAVARDTDFSYLVVEQAFT